MSRLIARFDVDYSSFHLDVDVDVPAAGITAVFGQSGSGKTTLLRCLAGLERSPTGFMRVGDDVWQDESRHRYEPISRRRIGYVFQEPRLFPHLSVRSNLTYGFNRTPVPDRRLSVEQVVDVLGIAHLLDRRPHKLSGGEQQRVAIGRALLTSPKLLLLDEPLSSLDSQRKREIMPFIQGLYKELNIPVVYVTHSLHEILQLAQVVGRGATVESEPGGQRGRGGRSFGAQQSEHPEPAGVAEGLESLGAGVDVRARFHGVTVDRKEFFAKSFAKNSLWIWSSPPVGSGA